MNNFKLTWILALAASMQACVYIDSDGISPRGPQSTESWYVDDFDRVSVTDGIDVHLRYGAASYVEATGAQRDLDDLEIEVSNNKLVARFKDKWFSNRQRLDLYLTTNDLSAVEFSGAVDADINGFDNLSTLQLKLTSASECTFDGYAGSIQMDLSGASELKLKGTSEVLNGKLSGASELHAVDYPVKSVILDLSGASEAYVWALDDLDIKASGASKVRYKGSPSISQDVSGSSSVKRY
ncbi:putative autotransporter adhesin-like protein [Dyadobacter jejuensis]|uniref:Putative autotransporter adhesin-like protein n=1 Tax=Dyadobacter jejuensis TaxID=1082580 RepID=A0A316AHN5_9BACT|nr:head GIN domain-containing protein [Dyadobacter jejuensis]PWJ57255.1 putative autotransporter adhesin-like protein [Dyadobacter jejuensis]